MMTLTELRKLRHQLLGEAQNLTGEAAEKAKAQLETVDLILGTHVEDLEERR